MYGDHHHQPQNHCRYDELDPCLVVREPSMHPVHGQPPSRLPRSPNPNTLSRRVVWWRYAILSVSSQPFWPVGLGLGATAAPPGLSRGSPIGKDVVPGVVPATDLFP
jgi:hypothetical protein